MALFDTSLPLSVAEARLLHRGSGRGYVCVPRSLEFTDPTAPRPWRQEWFSASQLNVVAEHMRGKHDMFLSQATFVRKQRRAGLIHEINCAFVDLDVYKLGLQPDEQTIELVLETARWAGLPVPTYVTQSGRGLYAKWLFTEPVTATHLPAWQALQQVILHVFSKLKADPNARDVARVLRLSETINSKTNTEVTSSECSGQLYDFHELCAVASTLEVPEEVVLKTGRQTKIADPRQVLTDSVTDLAGLRDYAESREPIMLRRFTPESLNWCRFLDLRDLAIRRGGIFRGQRDLYLFWMMNFLAGARVVRPDNFMEEAKALLRSFPHDADFKPLEQGVLKTLLARVRMFVGNKRIDWRGISKGALYTPSTDFLINTMQVSDEEMREMRTIISSSEKRRRSDEKVPGRAQRRQERQEAQCVAATLRTAGESLREIAQKVGRSAETVRRWITEAPAAGQPVVETRGRRAKRAGQGTPPIAGSPLSPTEANNRTYIHPGKPHLKPDAQLDESRLMEWFRKRHAQAKAASEQQNRQAQQWREQDRQREQAEIAELTKRMAGKLASMAHQARAGAVSNIATAFVSSLSRTGPPAGDSALIPTLH